MSKGNNDLDHILELVTSLSIGEYSSQEKIISSNEQIDSIQFALDMIAEELADKSSSFQFFEAIFNYSFDYIFILNEKGVVTHLNSKGYEIITNKEIEVSEKNFTIGDFFKFNHKKEQKNFTQFLKNNPTDKVFEGNGSFTNKDKEIFAKITTSYINAIKNFVVIIKDITIERAFEQTLLKSTLDSEMNARHQIARDLHDSVGQNLSGAKIIITQLKHILQKNNLDIQIAESITEIVNDAIKEIRDISHNLMPSYLRFSLNESLINLTEKIDSFNTYKVNFLSVGKPFEVIPSTQENIYRVVQEFANNTTKHAEATELNVKIEYEADSLNVKVQDNGKGFDMNETHIFEGIGLKNIISRVKTFNGVYFFSSTPNVGTELEFSINSAKK